jgi:hypothetical protein
LWEDFARESRDIIENQGITLRLLEVAKVNDDDDVNPPPFSPPVL